MTFKPVIVPISASTGETEEIRRRLYEVHGVPNFLTMTEAEREGWVADKAVWLMARSRLKDRELAADLADQCARAYVVAGLGYEFVAEKITDVPYTSAVNVGNLQAKIRKCLKDLCIRTAVEDDEEAVSTQKRGKKGPVRDLFAGEL